MTAPRRSKRIEELLTQFSEISDDAVRKQFLARHRSLSKTEVVTAIAEKVLAEVRIDVQRALRLADAGLAIADNVNDRESRARAFRAKANALYVSGQNAAAAEQHAQAVALFDEIGKLDEVARTLSGSIQPLLLMGDYTRAFAAGERARQIFTEQGNTWRLARLEINIGNIYYRQDRFKEAVECYERAYIGLLDRKDTEGTAAVLSNLATCYISLNDFPRAHDSYQKARDCCEQNGMPLLVNQADYNIAYLHYLRGEYSRAIEMLRATRLKCKKNEDAYHLALCNLDLSELYLELNLSSDAAELAEQGYEGFNKLGMKYESAKCLAFSAIAASQRGHAFESLKLFEQAREIFVQEKNQAWPSLIDLYRALVFFNEGRFFEARRLCTDALESFRKFRLLSKKALAQLLLARIALQSEQPEEAALVCSEVLKDLTELQSPVLSYQAHFLMGKVHLAQSDLGGAYDAFKNARTELETLRSSLRGEELKIAFIKNRLEIYEDLVEICLSSNRDPSKKSEAFEFIEQAKSRSLINLFLRPVQASSASEPGVSELVRSIRDLREELNWYYNLIEREQLKPEAFSEDRIAKLQRQARSRENELLRMLREATDTDAEQAGLQTPTNLSIADIRKALPDGTLVVEYFAIRDRILVCLLGKEKLEIIPITLTTRIAGILRLLQFQLSKFRLGSHYVSSFQSSLIAATNAHLRELYAELIAPIRTQLQCEHVVFVPHGLLHYVPFHALCDGSQYLIDQFTVSYAPSASIYALSQSRTANSTGPALIFGVPDQQAPAISDEVQSLTAVIPQSELFLGQQANEDVLRAKGPSSRLIHIATHGYFRQDNPMFSAIRLGDSFLSLYDLYNLRLPVELITLSGCATGLNVVDAGDELIGMARGLLHAGAQSLILSLWDVHDSSTAQYMQSFYGHLGEGKTKAKSLQAAMIDLRESYPHPYQWAPFVLVGRS